MSIDFIMARRSIRRYTDDPISRDDLRKILEAAMAAPSSRDRKPWHFVVVTGREILKRLADAHPHGKMLAEAAAAVAVCGDTNTSPDYWVQDCSASTENILIAVAALGLGAVWLGCHPRKDRVDAIREVLNIPEDVGILSLISIGNPAEQKDPRTQYDEERVHQQSW
ncbi:MAG: nitroreductase family protein [Candidatus Latescibacteria bacterium]|nr:nitroreductase family protein [bacterium]MBD3424241.1 nitroreductase family protein [Candidatus Latescibacterota bacterium]